MAVSGGHDLGGAGGFGRVVIERDEPVWHADWEWAVFATSLFEMAAGWFGLDMARCGIESMEPDHYLSSSYYAHWLHACELWGTRNGGVDSDELAKRNQHYLENPGEALPEDATPTCSASSRRCRPTASRPGGKRPARPASPSVTGCG